MTIGRPVAVEAKLAIGPRNAFQSAKVKNSANAVTSTPNAPPAQTPIRGHGAALNPLQPVRLALRRRSPCRALQVLKAAKRVFFGAFGSVIASPTPLRRRAFPDEVARRVALIVSNA